MICYFFYYMLCLATLKIEKSKCSPLSFKSWRNVFSDKDLTKSPGWGAVELELLFISSKIKTIQTVHSEGDQPWDFFGRNDAKAETPVLWPPHAKS